MNHLRPSARLGLVLVIALVAGCGSMPRVDPTVTRPTADAEPAWRAALVALERDQPTRALDRLSDVRRLSPRFVRAHVLYQDVMLRDGRDAQVAAEFEPPPIRDGVSLLLYARVGRNADGEPLAADTRRRLLDEALEREPGLAWAHLALGFEHEQAQQIDAAIAHFERAVRIDRKFPEGRAALARTYEKAFRPADARREYQEYLALAPLDAVRWFKLGSLQQNAGQAMPAEASYRRVLEIAPDALRRAMRTREVALTPEQLKRYESRAPLAYAARVNLSDILLAKRKLDEAINVLARAIADAPSHPDAHFNIGIAYERRGDAEAAFRHWRQYLALGGDQRERVSGWIEALRQKADQPAGGA